MQELNLKLLFWLIICDARKIIDDKIGEIQSYDNLYVRKIIKIWQDPNKAIENDVKTKHIPNHCCLIFELNCDNNQTRFL